MYRIGSELINFKTATNLAANTPLNQVNIEAAIRSFSNARNGQSLVDQVLNEKIMYRDYLGEFNVMMRSDPADNTRLNLQTFLYSLSESSKYEKYYNLNTFDEVKDGRLTTKDQIDDVPPQSVRFKIPLMLKTIGAMADQTTFKEIPLSVFQGGLRIVLELNPYAFYIEPYIEEPNMHLIDIEYQLRLADVGNLTSKAARSMEIKNLHLSTVQFRYDDDPAHVRRVLEQINRGAFKQKIKSLNILDKTFFKNYPNLPYTRNISVENVTKIQAIITSDIGLSSPYAKIHDRYNRGVRKLSLLEKGGVYPSCTLLESHNSLNTSGKENCSFFYQELKKGINKQIEGDYGITPLNFAVNSNFHTLIAMLHLMHVEDDHTRGPQLLTRFNYEQAPLIAVGNPKIVQSEINFAMPDDSKLMRILKKETYEPKAINKLWYRNLNTDSHRRLLNLFTWAKHHTIEMYEKPCSKTIYSLHLESIHDDKKTDSTVSFEFSCPITFSMERVTNYDQVDVFSSLPYSYYYITYFLENEEEMVLTNKGEFKRN